VVFHFLYFVTFAGTRALVTRRIQGNKRPSGEGDIQGYKPRSRTTGGAEPGAAGEGGVWLEHQPA